jgi:GGDEF domain-containing protein
MSLLPATPSTLDTVSAADAEDGLLAALAPRLQADRVRLLQMQRRIKRLRGLLHDNHEALLTCRAELTCSRRAAVSDALTGLPNRRGLEPPRRRELAKHAGGTHLLALLFVDLSGFKAVNDRLGHASGDKLLRIVGARLVNGMRRSDLVCRYGGDGFMCLLPRLHSATRGGVAMARPAAGAGRLGRLKPARAP